MNIKLGHFVYDDQERQTVIFIDNTEVFLKQGDVIESHTMLWNTETLAWEASTKGSGVGETVSIENFPAVISGVSVPVTGEFYPITQPISVASLPLPSGAATEDALQSILTELEQKTEPANIQNVSLNGERIPIDPMTDYDVAIAYVDSKISEIVVSGGGKTKTMVIGWTGEDLTSITTTIA